MSKVLVVDDNKQNRCVLQTLLMRNGYDVTLADDGAEALKVARDKPPDLIIADILMPGMDGYALCRQWKREEKLKKVPFVFYTSTYTDPKDEQLGLDMGADRFIRKPQELDALLGILKEVIEAHKAGRQTPAPEPVLDEKVYFREYNAALVRKLEDKLVQLESARASLEIEISGHTRAAHDLEASEMRYRRLFETAKDGILILDAGTGRIVDVNPFLADLLGYTPEYFLGKELCEIGLFKDITASEAAFFELQEKGYIRYDDLPLKTRGGRQIDVEFVSNVYSVNSGKVIQCNIRDITERKRSEEERALNFETQAAMNALMGFSLESKTIDEFLKCSLDLILSLQWLAVESKGAVFLADTAEETLRLHVHKGFSKDLSAMCSTVPFGHCICGRAAAARAVQFADRVDDHHDTRYEGMPPHGHYCVPILSGDRILGVINLYVKEGHTRSPREEDFLRTVANTLAGTIERKRAEDALSLHAKRVQALLGLHLLSYAHENQVLDFVLEACLGMTQSKLSFVGAMNETESVITTYRWSKEVMAECAIPAKSIEFPICTAGLWADCVRRREPVICNNYQAPHPGKKGIPSGHVPIHRFAAVPVLDGTRIVAVATVANKEQDYTTDDTDALSTLLNKMWEILSRQRRTHERETLEEQYRQAQKMEAIGQLAGGVAHDFNNILQSMVGYSGMLLDRLPEHDETHEFAEEIAHGAEQAAALTRQLLTFSRRQILEMEDLEFNDVVHGLTKMIQRIIGENIEVKAVDDPHLGIVRADRGQMEQVLLNLCVNARDAMPEGGTLTIKTENVALDSEYCAAHAWASPGRYMLLSVMDNGCGMDAATQARIFEPFFTTKEVGKGTGLGLATVYGIVRQHGGMVQVYSEVEKGTTFKIYLPSVERTAAPVAVKVVERARGGTETILVAEDEETLRKLALRILETAGYTVLLAANGKDALDVFAKHAAEIDLIVLDVVMPKMGGKAVYDALYAQHPRLRFLFSSGYSRDAALTGFVLQEGIELIQKPYGPNELLSKVREILDQAREEGIPK